MSDWLELELAERLSPVEAPAELWDRVARPRRRAHRPLALVAPIAAVVTLILAGALWFMARGQQAQGSFRPFPASARGEACLMCHTTM